MEDKLSIEYLYKTALKDFILIFYKSMKKEGKNNEDEIKIRNKNIKELVKDCYCYMNNPSISKAAKSYYSVIFESLNKYLNDVNEYIEGKEQIENFPIIKTDEHDIYKAYGFLCGIRIIVEGMDLQKVSKFNFKECGNFKQYLDAYGNSRNLTKNYEANFREYQKDKKDFDLKLINNWIKKINEKQLSSMKKKNTNNHKRNKKNKDNNDKNIINIQEQNNINNNNNVNKDKINEGKIFVEINQKNQTTMNQNNIVDSEKSSLLKTINVINIKEKNEKNPSIEKEEEKKGRKESNDESEDKNMELIMIGKSININKNEVSKIKYDKSSDKNHGNINEESEIYHNKIEGNNKDLSGIMTNSTNKESKDILPFQNKIQENKESSEMQGVENNEIKINNFNLNSSISIQPVKNKEKKEEDNPIEVLRKEMKEMKDLNNQMWNKIVNLETENQDINKKIKKLEINQLLMYHQISMYQTSRDIYKSIYTYYFQYLNLKKICPNPFEKLKAIMDYIKEQDNDKLTRMQYDSAPKIPDELKIKLANYFKLHFFLNKVSNKIVHRNFSEEEKRILKEQKDDDDSLLPLIPDFDFEQCFETLEYYIENCVKNKKLKKAMEIIYKEKYINDEKLGSIKDENGDVIKTNENGIQINFRKEDLEEIKNYFKNIDIKDESFVKLRNNKVWDKEEKEEF